jgi:hypothetical protein
MKDKSQKEYLWKWPVVMTVVGLFLTSIGIFIVNPLCQKKIAQKQLEYGVKPSFSLSFEPGKGFNCESSYFLLKNHGPGRLDRVWFVETVFLVEPDSVHECPDLPHFEYYHFKGSPRFMGVLEAGAEKQIPLTPCWKKAFGLFSQKYAGKLVSLFTLTGTALASPEFKAEFFFVIDPMHCDFIQAENYTGGKKLIEIVEKYLSAGPASVIRWVCFEGPCVGFYKNPPKWWYMTSDSAYVPWYGPDLPPYERSHGHAIQPIFFSPYFFFLNGSGYAKFTWSCDSELGPTAELMGSIASW